MGRSEPSLGRPPPGFRRDARAKKAKATVNKLIPALLNAHPRARRGIDAAELILDPAVDNAKFTESTGQKKVKQAVSDARPPVKPKDKGKGKKGKGRGRKSDPEPAAGYPAPAPAPAPEVAPAHRRSKSDHNPNAGSTDLPPPRVRLAIADTLTVARYLLEPVSHSGTAEHAQVDNDTKKRPDLANTVSRVGILNMASPLSPGGGFLNGAMAQEESLCMRTTLLPSLKDDFYRLPELGAVYTPDVLVFRDQAGSDLEKRDRWFVDCVSAAMLRFPEVEDIPDSEGDQLAQETGKDGASDSGSDDGPGSDDDEDDDDGSEDAPEAPVLKRYVNQKDRDTVLQKMRIVMRIFKAKGCRRIVLGGTWGCGAYGNPVEEVAAAWRKVLLPQLSSSHKNNHKARPSKENWRGIEEIVFAIKGGGMASRFQDAFLGSPAVSRGGAAADGSSSSNTDVGTAVVVEGQVILEHIDPKLLSPFSTLSSRKHDNSGSTAPGSEEGLDPEEVRMRELRERIAMLEVQVKQARSEQLRNGLTAVLAGLKSQVPPSSSQLEDNAENAGLLPGSDEDDMDESEAADDDNDDDSGSCASSFVNIDHSHDIIEENKGS